MEQINELSTDLYSRAAIKAGQRGDTRGEKLEKKFYSAPFKFMPPINFTADGEQKQNKVIDILRNGDNRFEIRLDNNEKILLNLQNHSAIFVAQPGYDYKGKNINVIFDRKSANILASYISKIIKQQISPTLLPLKEHKIKDIMKQDLTVHQFSLKRIIENLDKIPERTGKFGEPSNTLSKDEKRKLHELMSKFNEYGHSLRSDQALMETAKKLSEIAAMAKKYAMNENNDDFMQKETVQRDFKQVENITGQFQKLAKECVSRTMQLAALYEDLGHIYERYYEMENINEVAPTAIPETNLNMSECGTCGCGDPNHDTGHSISIPEEEQDEYASGFEEGV